MQEVNHFVIIIICFSFHFSSQSKICAIEAKLKLMEKTQSDFTLSTKPVGSLTKQKPVIPQSQTIKHGLKPYNKNAPRR
jgi:hypothetical protein